MEDRSIHFDEINLHGLISMLLKNLWVVVALCISAVLCFSSLCRLNYTPNYTSTATFMVSAKDSTSAYNSLTTTQSMASVFVEVFQSNVLREKIQEQMPNQEFDGTVHTVTIPETNLLIVTVTSSQPDMSFRALNLLVENYSSISDYVFSNAQLEVIKDPVVPVAPSNPLNVEAKYPLVLFISGVLAVGGIVAMYLLRDTVKTPKAARRKIDARLLRTVHHERKNKTLRSRLQRKNTAPLITNSLITKDFIEDNLSMCSALEYRARKRGQKVILVTSVGENEGKSTIAANLALALAGKGRRVALLDCDFRKPSMHKIFEMPQEQENTLTGYLLQSGEESTSCLVESKKHGIYLGISQGTGRSVTRMLNNGKLSELLQQLRGQMDYIILDTPPMLAAADTEALAAMADTAMLVVRADFMPTSSINEGMDRLRKSTPDVCGYVLNNYYKGI
ncbi:MAG: AAA family ATPase [Oscillospiraceae bacterium]|nr:AAA family ATPase [Oscillospiraceae bacterium]